MLIWLSERYRAHIQEIGALSDALESRLFPEGAVTRQIRKVEPGDNPAKPPATGIRTSH